MTSAVTDFDAAKTIVEQLKGLDQGRQERVLRWVAESLGLAIGSPVGEPVRTPAGIEPAAPPPVSATTALPVDIKTFVASKNPRSDIQFAAVVAYYYRFAARPEHRKETIDATTLQEAARLTGRTGKNRLKKPLVTLNNAKRQGYLDSASRGAFQINTVGENLVAMTLPGTAAAAPPPQQARRAAKARTGRAGRSGKK